MMYARFQCHTEFINNFNSYDSYFTKHLALMFLAIFPMAWGPVYCATKHALLGYTRSWAVSITVTSHKQHGKSPTTQIFVQHFLVWKQRKHRSCALPTLCKESLLVTRGGFPTQGVSNAENVSMLWRHMSSTTFSANNSHYIGTPVDMLYPYPGTHTHPALGDELKCMIRKRFRHYSLCGESSQKPNWVHLNFSAKRTWPWRASGSTW